MTETIELKNRKIVVLGKKQYYTSIPKPLMDTELLSIDEIYTIKFIPQTKKKKK